MKQEELMIEDIKCLLGIHKPAKYTDTCKHQARTNHKGKSKRKWHTWAKDFTTVTYCERCGKILSVKNKFRFV